MASIKRLKLAAEIIGVEVEEVHEYKPVYTGPRRLPIYKSGDDFAVVVLRSDTAAMVAQALRGRSWVARQLWQNQVLPVVYQSTNTPVPLEDTREY
jgi:hypothetical protein